MTEQNPKLGKLNGIYPVSPAIMQRAVIIAVLSFLFFLAMMLGFYLRQNIIYFLLSTAFLIIYIITMFSLLMMRKNVLRIYENGLKYKNFTARWNEIKEIVRKDRNGCEIRKSGGEKIALPESIAEIENVFKVVHAKISVNRESV